MRNKLILGDTDNNIRKHNIYIENFYTKYMKIQFYLYHLLPL